MREADFIVVGSGSGGSALAARLSESGEHSVIVVEFGGSDAGPFIRMPAALSYPMSMRFYDWGLRSEPEPALGGRSLATPRGKVIGGSSSINGMVYVRGHARDFDTWEKMGARGWSFADVLPYFIRLEHAHGGDDGWRGRDGPLHVTRGGGANPLYAAFIKAGAEAGFPLTDDYNGRQQEGFGPMEMTVWNGRRWSAADAYLKPALKRANLTLLTRTLARRILFDGHRATGIEVERGGRVETLVARREVILSASSINSPKLLLASGIGPGADLQALGIPVLADRPGVGCNLQDHLEVYIQQESRQPITLNGKLGLVAKGMIGLEWLLTGKGLGATNHFEACAFVRSGAGVDYPDIQFHFLPAAIRYDGKSPVRGHGYQVHVGPMRSPSRGTVTLRDPDPRTPPKIRFNYMSTDQDWADFRTAVRLAREVFGQPAFDAFRGREIAPGEDARSDEAIDAFIREHVESAYHPCGTCRMGSPDDPGAVVDPQARVYGVEGLRIADSSVFPQVTNGNLNGPSIMVGEKVADAILGRPPPPRMNLEPWVHPRWRTEAR
ncbi:MAG TPA: choline dehydrogenase [Methylomirabilota bacterium]|nr:choline dehydrogenase [Methylomirabilota bacterium]